MTKRLQHELKTAEKPSSPWPILATFARHSASMLKNTKNIPHLAALAAMTIWGLSFIWTKQLLDHLEPASILMFRLLISAVFLFLILFFMRSFQPVRRSDIPLFLLAAFFEPFLYFMGESHGLRLVSATVTSVIISTIPVFTAIFAGIFLKEHLSKLNLFGLVFSFAGILIILVDKEFNFSADPKGVLFLFGAVASAVLYGMILKKLTLSYHALTIVWVQNLIGIFYFLPVALIAERESLMAFDYAPKLLFPLVMLGLLGSSFAFVFFAVAVKNLGVSKANVYTNLIPVFTAIFSIILLGDMPVVRQLLGMVVVITGVAMSQITKEKAVEAFEHQSGA